MVPSGCIRFCPKALRVAPPDLLRRSGQARQDLEGARRAHAEAQGREKEAKGAAGQIDGRAKDVDRQLTAAEGVKRKQIQLSTRLTAELSDLRAITPILRPRACLFK